MKNRTDFASIFQSPLALERGEITSLHHRMLSLDVGELELPSAAEGDLDPAAFLDESRGGGSIALVPIHGLMTKRVHWWSSRQSTDQLATLIEELASSEVVETIVIDAASGGGEVGGVQRLGRAVQAAAGEKRVIACVNEFAASGCLWAIAGANEVVIPPTGQIGSLGVYSIHSDWSELLKSEGIQETVIHAGKYKAIDFRTLDSDLKAHKQDIVDGLFSEFVDDVAAFRGVSSEECLSRWGDARMFLGQSAVDSGLADRIGTLPDVLADLSAADAIGVGFNFSPESESDSMIKFDAKSGNLVADGKPVAHISEIGISAADVSKFLPELVKSLEAAAVASALEAKADELEAAAAEAVAKVAGELAETPLGEQPLKDVLNVLSGEKSAADARVELAEKTAEEAVAAAAEAEKNASRPQKPGFGASDDDGGSSANAAVGVPDDADPELAKEWKASAELRAEFSDFESFAAYSRHSAAGMVRGQKS